MAQSEGRGQGTTFIVTLPVLHTYEQKIMPQTTDLPIAIVPHLAIVIIDDNKDAADALARLLQMKGHTTRVAYSGTELLEVLETFTPEVMLLDIGLPDKTGHEIARDLRAQGFSGRLLALSGYGQKEDKEKALSSGFDRHFTKPIAIAQLEEYLGHTYKSER